MLTRNQQVGMFCFVIAIVLVVMGIQIWKQKRAEWIPGYKKKKGENTEGYCAAVGKGVFLAGVGMFILSVPISLVEPNPYFALSCMICCLVFVGMGVSLWFRAEKMYRP